MILPELHSAPWVRFFGTRLTPFSASELALRIEHGRGDRERATLIGTHNLHSLALLHGDRDMRAFYAACDHCYVDGVPVLWLLRALGAGAGARRFTLMDTLPLLLDAAAAQGWHLGYLGGTPEVVTRARAWLSAHWPGLAVTLVHGYQRRDETAVDALRAAAPDVLLVGMGSPRQERWILDHRGALPGTVMLQAGGTLDYYVGAQPRPPAALSRRGLGGLYRLLRDPRRLGRRYLIEPWSLAGPLGRLIADRLRAKAQHGNGDAR